MQSYYLGPEGSISSVTSSISSIFQNLKDGSIPENEKYPRTFRLKDYRLNIIKYILSRKLIIGPYLRCFEDDEAKIILKEIHEVECRNHIWVGN